MNYNDILLFATKIKENVKYAT